jgi:hypothetical protein
MLPRPFITEENNGTPRVLEELISDISGWDGKLVEAFQRLARARHGLDPHPARLAGRFTVLYPADGLTFDQLSEAS